MPVAMRLAVGQAPADLGVAQDRLNWLQAVLPEIAENADLLLLPELFACGYNIGDAVNTHAEASDGPTAQAIAQLARTHKIAIHYGFAERAKGVLYNAAQCVGPSGEVLCLQHKLAIPPGFEQDYFAPGEGCTLFNYCGLRIGTLICFDAEFPETVRHVAAQGAELVLVPTALNAAWDWVADTMIPTRAYENGAYLAYANSAGAQGDMTFLGRSVIATPGGNEDARAGPDSAIIYAGIEKARVTSAQTRLPYLLDRSRLSLHSR